MDQILSAARQRFTERGYHQTTLKAVAGDVGITDAGLMHYFPTKVHLLAAVSRARSEASDRTWAQLADAASLHQILAMMWWTTCLAQREPGIVEMSVAAAAEGSNPYSPVHDEYAAYFAESVSRTAHRFAACRDRGELRGDVDPEVLARACFALGNGLNTQWVLDGRSFDLGQYLLASLVELARSVAAVPADSLATEAAIREAAAAYAFATPA